MEKKNLSGEYLAPKVKVTQAKVMQVLCSSGNNISGGIEKMSWGSGLNGDENF